MGNVTGQTISSCDSVSRLCVSACPTLLPTPEPEGNLGNLSIRACGPRKLMKTPRGKANFGRTMLTRLFSAWLHSRFRGFRPCGFSTFMSRTRRWLKRGLLLKWPRLEAATMSGVLTSRDLLPQISILWQDVTWSALVRCSSDASRTSHSKLRGD
jgi:hypothetical protein